MNATVRIRGAEGYDAMLKAFPEKAQKAALQAMRKAAQATARQAKSGVPRSFRSIVKGIAKKSRQDGTDVYAVVGMIAPHRGGATAKSSGDRYWKWIRAYWQNYGTLDNRYRGHGFSAARKHGTRNWKGGIEPRLFWDRQETGLVSTYSTNLEHEYVKAVEKQFDGQ